MASFLGNRIERPPYMGWLILATAAYLLTELAFNAHLLDVAGGVSDIHDIERVEHYGRLISGVAAALAVCGSFIFPSLAKEGASAGKYLAACILLGGPIIAGVYQGEKKLVDILVAKSTAEERQQAALLSAASHQLRRDGIEVKGINIGGATLGTPEGKAFVALFTPIVFQLPEAGKVLDNQLNSIARQIVADSLGGIDGFYDKAYSPSLKQMEEFFGRYADAVDGYTRAHRGYSAEATKAWANYEARLKKHRMTPDTVQPAYFDRVRSDVRKAGVPVHSNWIPSDKGAFLVAFRDAYQKRISARLNEGMRSAGLTTALPLNLGSFDKFLGHPVVQKRWKESINVPEAGTLKNGMTKDAFDKAVFAPMVARLAKDYVSDLRADVVHFEPGGRLWTMGEEAMRSVVVPPLALGLSILGAIVHLCKVMLYTSKVIIPYSRVGLASMALFVALAIAPFGLPNAITQTQTYANVERSALDSGRVTPYLYRWVIQSQAYAYPVNNWVREKVLPGLFK